MDKPQRAIRFADPAPGHSKLKYVPVLLLQLAEGVSYKAALAISQVDDEPELALEQPDSEGSPFADEPSADEPTDECCLIPRADDFGLSAGVMKYAAKPYCEARKANGLCYGREPCELHVMGIVKRVRLHDRKMKAQGKKIKSFSGYLFTALQQSLIEDAEKLKQPRGHSHSTSGLTAIGDIKMPGG